MASIIHKLRYPGTRWAMVYGDYEGIARFAVNELQRMAQSFLPYVIEVHGKSNDRLKTDNHLIIAGTAEDNALIKELIARRAIRKPEASQGYTVAGLTSPWNKENKIIVVAGADSSGVLYGVADLGIRVFSGLIKDDFSARRREQFDKIESFSFSDFPKIANRGIWGWAYCVCADYRRFLDSMARLRMNMLTLWVDSLPVNWQDVRHYAQARGIKLILGFHWGWGLDMDLANAADRQAIKKEVLANYRRTYQGLGMDGIYFQTLTEHCDVKKRGRSTASYACELVNEIARELFKEEPDLYIQFGLHASSILQNYRDLKPLDPRVVIVWEDAGVVPYSYTPELDSVTKGVSNAKGLDTFEKTLAYSKKLVNFRGPREFAIVPKGWTVLNWEHEFEHHGPFILGERDANYIRNQRNARQPRWDYVNKHWLKNYPIAARFYREMLALHPPKLTVTALIEDGLIEQKLEPSVSLFAETIWNPFQRNAQILQRAYSSYYIS